MTAWTNTSITLASFAGFYDLDGNYVMTRGDKVAVQFWNHQSGAGPAIVLATAGGAGAHLPTPPAATCSPTLTHVSAFHAGQDPNVTVQGTCFGTGTPFVGGDSISCGSATSGPRGR